MWPQEGDLDKAMQTWCEVWLRGEEGQVLGEVYRQGGKLDSSQGRGVGRRAKPGHCRSLNRETD